MSFRVSNSVEKNVRNVPLGLVVLQAGVAKDVLNDITAVNGEFAYRSIQNVGPNPVYVGVGHDTDKTNFQVVLAGASAVDANGFGQGGSFDASNDPERINCYSPLGTTIALTVYKRNDNAQGQGNILSTNNQGR